MTRGQIANIYHSGLNAIITLVLGLFEKIAELEREIESLEAKLAWLIWGRHTYFHDQCLVKRNMYGVPRLPKGLPYVLACDANELFLHLTRQRIGAVFRLWYAFKNDHISRAELIEKAEAPIARLRTLLQDNADSSSKEVRAFCNGLLDKWPSLFTFVNHEGVEPTNNLAERVLRLGIETRKISYCTRSEGGQLLRARLLTVAQTCRMQGRNCLEFLIAGIHAKRYELPFPSLLRAVDDNAETMSA